MIPGSRSRLPEPARISPKKAAQAVGAGSTEDQSQNLFGSCRKLLTLAKAGVREFLYAYSTLLFMRSTLLGATLLFCSFLNVNLGFAGFLSWLTAIVFSSLVGIKREDPVRTICEYNALIVGFSIGFLFRFSYLTFFLLAGASALTVLVSCTLYSLFTKSLRLPVLNIPFLIGSTIIYLASVRYSSLFVDSFYIHDRLNLNFLPAYIQGFLRSFGILIFMPYDICGLLMLSALLFFSRIAFVAAVFSYYLGTTSVALLTGNFNNAYLNVYAFNFILTGIAIGAVFLVPSRRSYLLACLGVFLTVFVLDAASVVWTNFGVPVFTLPFNLVVLLIVYVLMQTGYPEITLSIKASPEASLANHLNFARRFDNTLPRPFLPFSGFWTVYQGFDGNWTHKGIWKYAYDFVIEDEDGRTHKNSGDILEDYHCYGKPILAPVSGTVMEASDSFKDNAAGEVDEDNNWGNYLILRSHYGYYVEISHLKQSSFKVKPGDSVRVGEVLAACGNSGHSVQPHIHMQVQWIPQLGSETAKFYLSNCLDGDGRLVKNTFLEKGMKIESFSASKRFSKKLNFVLDDDFTFRYAQHGAETVEVRILVKMARDGSRYFNLDGTEDRLYFGFEENSFIFYSFDGKDGSPLQLLFAALPRVPLIGSTGISWVEPLPDNILFPGSRLYGFIKSLHHDLGKITGTYRFASENAVVGELSNGKLSAATKLVFDTVKGFSEVTVETSGKTLSLRKP